MRGLQTTDIFTAARIVKSAQIADEVKTIAAAEYRGLCRFFEGCNYENNQSDHSRHGLCRLCCHFGEIGPTSEGHTAGDRELYHRNNGTGL